MCEPPTAADAIIMPDPSALSLLSQVETPSCPAAEAESAPSTFAPAQAADAADCCLFSSFDSFRSRRAAHRPFRRRPLDSRLFRRPFRCAPAFGRSRPARFPGGSAICERRRAARRYGEENSEPPRPAQQDGVKTFGGWGRTRPNAMGSKGAGRRPSAARRKPPNSRQPSEGAKEPQTNRKQSNPRRSNRSGAARPHCPDSFLRLRPMTA